MRCTDANYVYVKYKLTKCSAKGGSRTPTPLRALDPKSSASTNSATLAISLRTILKARGPLGFLRFHFL